MIANAHCCTFAHVKDTDRHQHHPSTHQHHRPMSQPPITNHRHSCNTSDPHCARLASARIRAAHTNGHEREQEATRLGGEEVHTGTRLKENNICSESRLRLKKKDIRCKSGKANGGLCNPQSHPTYNIRKRKMLWLGHGTIRCAGHRHPSNNVPCAQSNGRCLSRKQATGA